MQSIVTRRAFAVGASSALGLGWISSRSSGQGPRTPAARLAHFTDLHIQTQRNAPAGAAAMFDHMAKRAHKPELILNTGDTVMAIDGKVGGAAAAEQIKLWKEAIQASPAPIQSCLGNHDIWNGHAPTEEIPAAMAGTRLMEKTLGLTGPWHSFSHGGWHFIALNSCCDWPNYGYLTPEHFDWLKADLKAVPAETPVCVLSHLPILSVTSLVYGDSCRKGNDNLVPGIWQHADCWAITELFRRHPNVRLCLSGHMHTQDRCEYRGVWYICGGAASGAWWQGSEYGFPPCYGALTLYADGKFDYEFVDYGWPAREWRGKQLAE